MSLIALFVTIYRSHYTISINFQLYLHTLSNKFSISVEYTVSFHLSLSLSLSLSFVFFNFPFFLSVMEKRDSDMRERMKEISQNEVNRLTYPTL